MKSFEDFEENLSCGAEIVKVPRKLVHAALDVKIYFLQRFDMSRTFLELFFHVLLDLSTVDAIEKLFHFSKNDEKLQGKLNKEFELKT